MDFEVLMPRLGDEMIHGTIVEWLVQEGDEATKGEPLFLVETGKAVLEVESEASGILKKILFPQGTEEIPIGDVIGIIETED